MSGCCVHLLRKEVVVETVTVEKHDIRCLFHPKQNKDPHTKKDDVESSWQGLELVRCYP